MEYIPCEKSKSQLDKWTRIINKIGIDNFDSNISKNLIKDGFNSWEVGCIMAIAAVKNLFKKYCIIKVNLALLIITFIQYFVVKGHDKNTGETKFWIDKYHNKKVSYSHTWCTKVGGKLMFGENFASIRMICFCTGACSTYVARIMQLVRNKDLAPDTKVLNSKELNKIADGLSFIAYLFKKLEQEQILKSVRKILTQRSSEKIESSSYEWVSSKNTHSPTTTEDDPVSIYGSLNSI